MTLQDLAMIGGVVLFAAFGVPLLMITWEKRTTIGQILQGSAARYVRVRPAYDSYEDDEESDDSPDNNNGATLTNGIAKPATIHYGLLSDNDFATLSNDPKVEPVDILFWEGRADALAVLIESGALKVTETEAATLVYGVKPSGTSPRWKLARAAINAAKERRSPPRFTKLDDQKRPVLQEV